MRVVIHLGIHTSSWRLSFCRISFQTLSNCKISLMRSWESLKRLYIKLPAYSSGQRSGDLNVQSMKAGIILPSVKITSAISRNDGIIQPGVILLKCKPETSKRMDNSTGHRILLIYHRTVRVCKIMKGPGIKWNNTIDHNYRLSGCMMGSSSIPMLLWMSPDMFLLVVATYCWKLFYHCHWKSRSKEHCKRTREG